MIFNYLRGIGKQVVWATSTPFEESVHNAVKSSRRYFTALEAYNEASLDLAATFHFQVNPLFDYWMREDFRQFLLPDGLHFTAEGNRKTGRWIADAILECLDMPRVTAVEDGFDLALHGGTRSTA